MSEIDESVIDLHLFPIKSCQQATLLGEKITQLMAGSTGLEVADVPDRNWVIANPNQFFASQRGWAEAGDNRYNKAFPNDSLLATVEVDIQPDHVLVTAPKLGSLAIPKAVAEGERNSVRIFGPELPVIHEGKEAADFFSRFLGRDVALWRADAQRPRELPSKYRMPRAANRSTAADGRPVTLASQSSLDYLHDAAGIPRGTLPLINFRANIDIAGRDIGPFGEDRLRHVVIGNVAAFVVKALERCPVPNIDQLTGDSSKRLATKLLMARRGWVTGEEDTKPKEYFAQSLNHVYIPGQQHWVKIGDHLTITKTAEPNVTLKK